MNESTTIRPPLFTNSGAACEQLIQLPLLVVHRHTQRLERLRGRMDSARTGHGLLDHPRQTQCRVNGPRPNDCSADSPRPPFLAESINQVGQFLFWSKIHNLDPRSAPGRDPAAYPGDRRPSTRTRARARSVDSGSHPGRPAIRPLARRPVPPARSAIPKTLRGESGFDPPTAKCSVSPAPTIPRRDRLQSQIPFQALRDCARMSAQSRCRIQVHAVRPHRQVLQAFGEHDRHVHTWPLLEPFRHCLLEAFQLRHLQFLRQVVLGLAACALRTRPSNTH